jgi:hypothetical protein
MLLLRRTKPNVGFAASCWPATPPLITRGVAVLLSAQWEERRVQPFEVTGHGHLAG